MVVEPAGAVGVAALMEGKIENPGTVAVILSGGNIDPMLMLKVIQRGLSAAGRYMTVRIMLDDRPGSLATIARIIAENDANVTGLDHTRIGGSISMGDVAITIDIETKGHEHCELGPRAPPRRGLPADRGPLGPGARPVGRAAAGDTPAPGLAGACWWWAPLWCCSYLIDRQSGRWPLPEPQFGLRPRSAGRAPGHPRRSRCCTPTWPTCCPTRSR